MSVPSYVVALSRLQGNGCYYCNNCDTIIDPVEFADKQPAPNPGASFPEPAASFPEPPATHCKCGGTLHSYLPPEAGLPDEDIEFEFDVVNGSVAYAHGRSAIEALKDHLQYSEEGCACAICTSLEECVVDMIQDSAVEEYNAVMNVIDDIIDSLDSGEEYDADAKLAEIEDAISTATQYTVPLTDNPSIRAEIDGPNTDWDEIVKGISELLENLIMTCTEDMYNEMFTHPPESILEDIASELVPIGYYSLQDCWCPDTPREEPYLAPGNYVPDMDRDKWPRCALCHCPLCLNAAKACKLEENLLGFCHDCDAWQFLPEKE